MKNYALEKLSKIEKFGGRVVDATVIMDIQKLFHIVEYFINVNNTKIVVTGRSNDMYASIDQAIDRLEGKLRRYLKRLHEHHAKEVIGEELEVNVIEKPMDLLDDINDQIEEENYQEVEKIGTHGEVVTDKTMTLKTLTRDEAIMKIDLSSDSFLLFRSEETQKINLIYRLKDGNYGVVEVNGESSL
ncbi:MAG: ribosome-associated translation inhibitor RaiA [Chlamydiia bacterium]|nr:ribosome-associated translation inhibitor RaiA [Chlamydiia bacterium]